MMLSRFNKLLTIALLTLSCTNSNQVPNKENCVQKNIGIHYATITGVDADVFNLGVENKIVVDVAKISSACVYISLVTESGEGELTRIQGPFFIVTPCSLEEIIINFEDKCTNEIKTFVFAVREK